MAKTQSTLKNMLLCLFIVSFVSAGSLGYVYEKTKEPIAKAALSKKTSALKNVLPQFDNDPLNEKYSANTPDGEITFYPAKKDGRLVGTAIETFTNKGYSGNIRLIVGLLPDGRINNIEVVEHKETPGLGDKIEPAKSKFSDQFNGKDLSSLVLKVKKDGGDVDAITAATISSRAFCDAIQRAFDAYKEKRGNN
ncbi:MAG: RnfABCDGE type electron transport complex subunit G [Candidatus Omnitrophica bacterium]|nr:RnfABCDGE type electron transport complex subunit G [Candidatus Omnitrophota bacterium]